MDNFPVGGFVFITDLSGASNAVRIELGPMMHKLLADDPSVLPTIAVQMIRAAIDKVTIDPEKAKQLQWKVTEAMTAKLAKFKQVAGEVDQPAALKPPLSEFQQAANDFAAKFRPCLILTSTIVGHQADGAPQSTFVCRRDVGEDCPARDAVSLSGAIDLGFTFHLQEVADELGITTEKLRSAINAANAKAKPKTRDNTE